MDGFQYHGWGSIPCMGFNTLDGVQYHGWGSIPWMGVKLRHTAGFETCSILVYMFMGFETSFGPTVAANHKSKWLDQHLDLRCELPRWGRGLTKGCCGATRISKSDVAPSHFYFIKISIKNNIRMRRAPCAGKGCKGQDTRPIYLTRTKQRVAGRIQPRYI